MPRLYLHRRGQPRTSQDFASNQEALEALDAEIEAATVAGHLLSTRQVLGRNQWDAYDNEGLVSRFWLEHEPPDVTPS